MILSSWPDHFPITVHLQLVCDVSQWSCSVDLTISPSLSTLSLYVMFLNDPVKLNWPFSNLCQSSACMWCALMILSSWLNHFQSVHPQDVCDGSQWSHQVDQPCPNLCPSSVCMWWFSISCQADLTIYQSLSILSLYVIFLNDPIKLTWPFPNLWPSSGCMWWFSMILSSWLDHVLISVHPEPVCDDSQWSCQVNLTFPNLHLSSACMWSFCFSCEVPQTIFLSMSISSRYNMSLSFILLSVRSLPQQCPLQGSRYWYPHFLQWIQYFYFSSFRAVQAMPLFQNN